MSLINDALKKAQRERSTAPEHPAAVNPTGAPPAGHAPRGDLRARSNPWPALLVVLALFGGGAAVWFLKPGAAPAPVVAANNQPPGPPVAASAEPVAAVAPIPRPAPEPVPTLQINLPGSVTPTTPSTAAPIPAPLAAAPSPAPAATPAAPEPLKITLQMEDPRVLAFLDAARINGVRSVADDAKLLMNNKVFRAGATVDRELGLKLMQILPGELVFEDSRGIQYRKSL